MEVLYKDNTRDVDYLEMSNKLATELNASSKNPSRFEPEIPAKICPQCHSVYHMSDTVCDVCDEPLIYVSADDEQFLSDADKEDLGLFTELKELAQQGVELWIVCGSCLHKHKIRNYAVIDLHTIKCNHCGELYNKSFGFLTHSQPTATLLAEQMKLQLRGCPDDVKHPQVILRPAIEAETKLFAGCGV